MRITAVSKSKKGFFSVYVDGAFAFSVDEQTMLEYHLAPQMETDPQALEHIRLVAEERYQKERALKLLGYKSYTKQSLIQRLARDCDEEIAHRVADRMEELGLINDEDYARRYAADLFGIKGYGGRRVLYELTRKGIPRELAQEVVSELAPEDEDTVETLISLIERKYARYLTDRKGIDKTVRALARLGYDYDDIRAAISSCADLDETYED